MRNPKAERLLQRLQNGEDAAMADLAEAYGPKIHQLAFRYLRNKEDAEEVVQDVLYNLYRSVGDFRGEAALSSWIYRITFNAAMSRLRSASYQRAQDAQRAAASAGADNAAPALPEPADWSNMADEQLLRSQLRRRVFRAVLALPAIYRAPVVLRDIHGMSTERASAGLGGEGPAVKARAARGRL